jgi:hypothetical protein
MRTFASAKGDPRRDPCEEAIALVDQEDRSASGLTAENERQRTTNPRRRLRRQGESDLCLFFLQVISGYTANQIYRSNSEKPSASRCPQDPSVANFESTTLTNRNVFLFFRLRTIAYVYLVNGRASAHWLCLDLLADR